MKKKSFEKESKCMEGERGEGGVDFGTKYLLCFFCDDRIILIMQKTESNRVVEKS